MMNAYMRDPVTSLVQPFVQSFVLRAGHRSRERVRNCSMNMRILAGVHRDPGRCAERSGAIGVFKNNGLIRQSVQIRRSDGQAAVSTQAVPSQMIRHQQEDMGSIHWLVYSNVSHNGLD